MRSQEQVGGLLVLIIEALKFIPFIANPDCGAIDINKLVSSANHPFIIGGDMNMTPSELSEYLHRYQE